MKRQLSWVCAVSLAAMFVILLFHWDGLHPSKIRLSLLIYNKEEKDNPLYKLDVGWPKNADYFTGVTFGVAVDPTNSLVYVAQRGENVSKVLVFTEEGYFKQQWNTDSIDMPHGIFAVSTDKEHSIWITDVGQGNFGHTVKKYSPSGKLLQVLGTAGKSGSALDPLQFDQPAEIFVENSGDLYIVDGDGGLNNRILKFTKDFWLLWTLGGRGTKPGQFFIPHSVTVDEVGRVWVADRGNKRMQAFDKTSGEWIGTWSSCFTEDGPYSVRLTADKQYFVVAQLNINRVLFLSVPPIGSIGDCHVASAIQMADGVKPHLVDVNINTGSIFQMGVTDPGSENVLLCDFSRSYHQAGGTGASRPAPADTETVSTHKLSGF